MHLMKRTKARVLDEAKIRLFRKFEKSVKMGYEERHDMPSNCHR